MKNKQTLIMQLEKEIINACNKSKRIVGYKAHRPIELLSIYGPVETVRQLITRRYINDAFVDLVLAGKTQLTLEYIACKTKYRSLFDGEMLKQAQIKLAFN
jgi:hypothetical protein